MVALLASLAQVVLYNSGYGSSCREAKGSITQSLLVCPGPTRETRTPKEERKAKDVRLVREPSGPSALGGLHLSCFCETATCPSTKGPEGLLEGMLQVSLLTLDWADGCLPS